MVGNKGNVVVDMEEPSDGITRGGCSGNGLGSW